MILTTSLPASEPYYQLTGQCAERKTSEAVLALLVRVRVRVSPNPDPKPKPNPNPNAVVALLLAAATTQSIDLVWSGDRG